MPAISAFAATFKPLRPWLSISSTNPNSTQSFLPLNSNAKMPRLYLVADSNNTTSVMQSKDTLMTELVEFLEEDLQHLFDEQGIDTTRYEEKVVFMDPLTKYDSLSGYLFNLQLLRCLFGPKFELHNAKQTGPNEITTRWTMTMNFKLLPWQPELVFTGVSVMCVNLETGKFYSHMDYWDSLKNNDYFSFEGMMDLIKQLRISKTPNLDTPKYKVLKRMADYEIRRYDSFNLVETLSNGMPGSSGFNNIAGYIFGKNATGAKIKMTTPVLNERRNEDKIQIVLPSSLSLEELPAPISNEVELRRVNAGDAAVIKFGGKPTEELVRAKELALRKALERDNLIGQNGFLVARYNDPDQTPDFLKRNEVIIWLEDFPFE